MRRVQAGVPIFTNTNIFTNRKKYKIGLQIVNANTKKYKMCWVQASVPIFTNTNIFIIQRNTRIGKLQIMDTNTKKYRNTVPGAGRRAHIHKYKIGKLQIYSQIQRNTRLENYK